MSSGLMAMPRNTGGVSWFEMNVPTFPHSWGQGQSKLVSTPGELKALAPEPGGLL
jgi:hypothetical protein